MQGQSDKHLQKDWLTAPDKILVATDLQDADYLLPHAIAQAKASGAQVRLLYAIPPYEYVPFAAEAAPEVDQSKFIRDVRTTLLGLAHRIESEGIPCETAARQGAPALTIQEDLSRSGAKRLIMGTHGRGKLGQFVLGSVAHKLIATARVPVFLVGPRARNPVQHVTPQKMLHAVSLKGEYKETVEMALSMAQRYHAELVLLHVFDSQVTSGINPERTVEHAKHALSRLALDRAGFGFPIHTIVKAGKPEEEILKVAREVQADWILLGVDGGSRSGPFKEGAAYKVIAAAACPVLIFRHRPSAVSTLKFKEVHRMAPQE